MESLSCLHFSLLILSGLHSLALLTVSPTPPPPPPLLPAACSPWATWPCSGSSASSSLAWLRGLCCCSISSSKTEGVGGQAEAGVRSPGMGRSGFTRSGKCGLMLGGSQLPSGVFGSSRCRREAENQPMTWASGRPRLSVIPTPHSSLGSSSPSSAPSHAPFLGPLHLMFFLPGALSPDIPMPGSLISSALCSNIGLSERLSLSTVCERYTHLLPLSLTAPLPCFLRKLSPPGTSLFNFIAPLSCNSRRVITLWYLLLYPQA